MGVSGVYCFYEAIRVGSLFFACKDKGRSLSRGIETASDRNAAVVVLVAFEKGLQLMPIFQSFVIIQILSQLLLGRIGACNQCTDG